MPSVSFYDTRPESLVYHTSEFHVMDIKVNIIFIFEIFHLLFFRLLSALAMISVLDQ